MIQHLELSEKTIPAVAPYAFLDSFNRVQSTLIMNGLPMEDCNLVLGTATSTGKTISAELFIYATLAIKKKVVYVAPMKALVDEKYEEWQTRFSDKSVHILTGDYKPTTASRESLKGADIVVLTSEMLDSQTRGGIRKEEHWLDNVGCIVMDEAHIIGSDSRGPAAEAGITRLCSINTSDPPRIVLLSATLPNVDDFTRWCNKLNNKKTYALNSRWRPVVLKWEFYPCSGKWYGAQRSEMISRCVKMLTADKENKYLIFTHEKKTGHDLSKALAKVGIPVEFHRADLAKSKRTEIENSFKSRDVSSLRVLLTTSTLAYGVNLPAKNVIIVGTSRGTQPLDMADIIQMSGRAGRAGIDTTGTCHLLCNDTNTSVWAQRVQTGQKVLSALLEERHLRFQVMAEIELGLLKHLDDLPEWFDKTLAGQQTEFPENQFNRAISKLVQWEMLTLNSLDELEITPLGKVGTTKYFTPDDIYFWYKFISDNGQIDTDVKIAALIGGSPTMCLDYIPKDSEVGVNKFRKQLSEQDVKHTIPYLFTPYALYEHLQGNANDQANLKFSIQSILNDIERIVSAVEEVSKLAGVDLTPDIVVRLRYGVPKQLIFLCEIPGIGPKRAWMLFTSGVTDPTQLKNVDRAVLVDCLGGALATKVWEHIHK